MKKKSKKNKKGNVETKESISKEVLSQSKEISNESVNKTMDKVMDAFIKRRLSNADELEKSKDKAIKILMSKIDNGLSIDKILRIIYQLNEMTKEDLGALSGGNRESNPLNLIGLQITSPEADNSLLSTSEKPRELMKTVEIVLQAAETIEQRQVKDITPEKTTEDENKE